MSTVTYVGKAKTLPQIDTITIGSATAAQTFTVTGGNGVGATYTAVGGDTTATVTTALLALLNAVTDPEFANEVVFAAGSSTTITATGPSDGTVVSVAVSGTGTISLAHTQVPSSPNDLKVVTNYSTGALPSNNDVLVFENADIDVKWNLDALAAITLTVIRRDSFTGVRGLPDQNANGYPEYRPVRMSLKSASITEEQGQRDQALQTRILNVTTGGATTITVKGQAGGGQLGSECLEVTGTPASSVVNMGGGSVVIAPLAGDAAVIGTINAEDAVIRLGSKVTGTPALNLKNCQSNTLASYGALTQTVGGTLEVNGAAAGTTTNVFAGSVSWRSTGAPGALVIGSGAVFDASLAPAPVTIGSNIEMNAGSSLNDPAGRLSPYTIVFNRCSPTQCAWEPGPARTVAVS